MIAEEFVVDFVQRTQEITKAVEPSFFELTMTMAFDYFARQQVDIAIIETGLGGRLDSTNIIAPLLSIITNIGYDHMNILGNTLEKIAEEKAGIIKQDTPVIIGEYLAETKQIFINKAIKCSAPIVFAQHEFMVTDLTLSIQKLHCKVTDLQNNSAQYFTLDLNGIYQTKNLCAVLCAKKFLVENGFIIKDAAVQFGIANTKILTGLHGRWDVICEYPALVLDVAHNEDGIKQVLKQIQHIKADNKTISIHFIMGMVKDKEVDKVLSLLPADAFYYFTNAHIPRALPAEELKLKAAMYNLNGNYFDSVNDAIKEAQKNAKQQDLIIVCGSVFVVGEVI